MDGDPATAILYVSEQEDLRQILVWTSEKKDAEVDAIHSNLKSVLVYFYLLHAGLCHENYVNDYFDIRGGTVNSDACDCPGCIYRKSLTLKESSSLFRKILGAVDMLAMVCDKVTEVNIRLFLKGDLRSCFWLQKKLDTLPIPLTSTTYSSMNNSQNLQPLLNVAVRQCICFGLLQIDFSTKKIPSSSPDIVKSLAFTEKRRHFLNSQETVKVPEQVQTFQKIHPNRRVNKSGKYESNINSTDSIEAPPEPTKRNMLQRIVWMIDQEFVEPVSSEDQVKFLGYFHDHKKLLYIENTNDFSKYEAVR